MTQNFTWQDLSSLPRYRKRQIFTDTALGITYAPGVLSSVLQSFMRRDFCVLVHPAGFLGQVGHLSHKVYARLTFVATKDSFSNPGMVDLLNHLCQQAGEMGAFRVLAEVEEGTPLAHHLLRAGFAPYAEQRIWRFPIDLEDVPNPLPWKPVSARHLGEIHALYQKLVPAEVRRVEPPPTAADLQGLVCRREGEMVGYAAAQFGPKGALLDVWLDHAQEENKAHLTGILSTLRTHRSQEVYVRVRSYQQKLGTAAESLSASPTARQLSMVKHLATHQKIRQPFTLPAIEQQPDVSTPMIKSERNS
ncbi:MAG: hypothetical protein MAG431_00656 [Chloroflexi bacterium]|nr:hypothetical protein [Chloroflexota bacterium]